jgi:hypothetical protein
MNYYNKYLKLKNQLGGVILGEGSFGIVVANPRLPMYN